MSEPPDAESKEKNRTRSALPWHVMEAKLVQRVG